MNFSWETMFIALSMILLFCLSYVSISFGIKGASAIFRKRVRMRMPLVEKKEPYARTSGRLTRHLRNLMEAVGWGRNIHVFVGATGIGIMMGLWIGLFFFLSIKGMIIMCIVLGGLPYLWLRMRLMSLQSKSQQEFLPAIEVFYQQYILMNGRNLRNIVHRLLLEDRIRYPMRVIFEQLDRNLAAHRNVEESLKIFTLSLGHVWARYFANMLQTALQEGANIEENLRELIADMRKAKINEKVERNRLLEIRIANFSPILFLIIFVGVNMKLDPKMAYTYYVLDPDGRDMLLDALLLIFASFIMGVYLSVGNRKS